MELNNFILQMLYLMIERYWPILLMSMNTLFTWFYKTRWYLVRVHYRSLFYLYVCTRTCCYWMYNIPYREQGLQYPWCCRRPEGRGEAGSIQGICEAFLSFSEHRMERQHPSDAVPVWLYLSLFNISVHAQTHWYRSWHWERHLWSLDGIESPKWKDGIPQMLYPIMKRYCKLTLLAHTSFYTILQNKMISGCSWLPLPYSLYVCVHAFTDIEAGSFQGITGTLCVFGTISSEML